MNSIDDQLNDIIGGLNNKLYCSYSGRRYFVWDNEYEDEDECSDDVLHYKIFFSEEGIHHTVYSFYIETGNIELFSINKDFILSKIMNFFNKKQEDAEKIINLIKRRTKK